jgi:hypothetical protein
MKKIYLFISFLFALAIANAQTYVSEDFTSSAFPPSGWTIDAHGGNWSHSTTKKANGKNSGEAKLHWSPQFNGYTRFISPVVDLTGVIDLSIEFNHMLDFYGGSTEHIGVATRSGGGDWNVVWETPGANISAEQKILSITTPDVGASDFQFCLYFHGNSYNINDWFIDDIRLFTPLEHDVKTSEVLGDTYFEPNDTYTPQASVFNYGLNTESFQVVCTAYRGLDSKEVVYTDTQTVNSLPKGEYQDVTFAPFNLSSPNDIYNIVVKTLLPGDMDTLNDSNNKYVYTYTNDRDMVMVEIGTGTGCPYCPGAAMGADDLVAAGKPVAVIEYHSYNSSDPFNTPEAAARTGYYGITGYPTAVFDGIESYVGGSNNQSLFPAYEPLVDARSPIKVGVGIQFTTTATTKGYHVVVTLVKYGPIMGDNLVLHFAVTESEIAYNWQGQSKLDYVERLMLPDANGTPVDLANNNTIVKEYDFEVGDDWNVDELEVVAFVQNVDTRLVMNGHKEMLKYVGIGETSANNFNLTTYPNPVSESATVSFNLEKDSKTSINVYSLQGQHIATLVDQNLKAGKHQVNWSPNGTLSNGVYLMKINIGGQMFTKKLAIQR